jgi:hypothetical protein
MGWVVKSTSGPLHHPGKDTVLIVQEAELVPGPVWTGGENHATAKIRYLDRPGRSKSLYRLSFPGRLDDATVILHLQLCAVEWGSVATICEGF